MKEKLNNGKLIYIIIIIITLSLYYIVRINENYLEIKSENNSNDANLIDDDINITSSNLLNIKVSVERIKEIILENEKIEIEKKEKKIENNRKQNNFWKIEIFFLSIFIILFSGLFLWSNDINLLKNLLNFFMIKKDKEKNNYNKESEMELLISKDNSNQEYELIDNYEDDK